MPSTHTRPHRHRQFTVFTVLLLLLTGLLSTAQPAQADTTDLFISEYIEGSNFNKAIEIYNGTGSNVDLSNYTLELYSNGASTAQPIRYPQSAPWPTETCSCWHMRPPMRPFWPRPI